MKQARTAKATRMGWCFRCRNAIYPGEWVRFGLHRDVHRYQCPDPDAASAAYVERLSRKRGGAR